MIWTAVLKFLKPFLPWIAAAAALFFGYQYIKNLGYNEGKDDGYGKAVKELAKLERKCPEVKPCPPQIDFDKIKSKNVTIQAQTVTNFVLNGDSTYRDQMRKDFREIMEQLEVVRVKKR